MSSVPPRHQIIHERRFPTTQIDNRRRAFWRSSLDEPEGDVKMCTVPTRRVPAPWCRKSPQHWNSSMLPHGRPPALVLVVTGAPPKKKRVWSP